MTEELRPQLSQYEALSLDILRDIKNTQIRQTDKLDDLSIRMTRVEDGHTSNDEKISELDNKLKKHIDE